MARSAQALLASEGVEAIEQIDREASPRRGRRKRDSEGRSRRRGQVLGSIAQAISRMRGAPIQLSKVIQLCGIDRNRAVKALNSYAIRDALPAFVAKVLMSGRVGHPSFVHVRALESASATNAPSALGYHGPHAPFDPTPDELTRPKKGKLVYLVATVVTDRGVGLACAFEPVPAESWRRRSWTPRARSHASRDQRYGESEPEYLRRKQRAYADQLTALVGRPADSIPQDIDALLLAIVGSLRTGMSAAGAPGEIADLPITGGWLAAPPSTPPALGFTPLSSSFRPLRELRDAGAWPLLDLCAATATETTDLRSVKWTLVENITAFSGPDLHAALVTGREPWIDVSAAAPAGGADLVWHVARGEAQEGVHRTPAALIALRDPTGRHARGLVRMCLDPLDSPESLRHALAIAYADSIARSPRGAIQRLKEEIAIRSALHVQMHAAGREPLVALALMAVDALIAAERMADRSVPEPQVIGKL